MEESNNCLDANVTNVADNYNVSDISDISCKVDMEVINDNSDDNSKKRYNEDSVDISADINVRAESRPTEKFVKPDEVPELKNRRDCGNGIVVYNVRGKKGRQAMCAIVDSHWSNGYLPCWLLSPLDNKKFSGRVAFKDGLLLAFFERTRRTPVWWDRYDDCYENGIPVTIKLPDDELGRSAVCEFNEDTEMLSSPKYLRKGDEQSGLFEEWYANGQLKIRQKYKDGRQDGLCELWYSNGQMLERSYYKDGQPYGLSECWYMNGRLMKRGEYRDGWLSGRWEHWYDDGQLSIREHYKRGVRDGFYKEWHPNGLTKKCCYYALGKLSLIYEEWYPNGQHAICCFYKDGKYDGLYRSWYENGQMKESCDYKRGIFDGVRELWRSNGNLLEYIEYKNGKREGLYVQRHKNGKLWIRREYKDDRKDGVCEMFDEAEKPIERCLWRNGEKVRSLPLVSLFKSNSVQISDMQISDSVHVNNSV